MKKQKDPFAWVKITMKLGMRNVSFDGTLYAYLKQGSIYTSGSISLMLTISLNGVEFSLR